MTTQPEAIYQWKSGWGYDIDPELVAEEIRRTEQTWGKCTPELLVGRCREEHHPMHHLFEWDDHEAGRRYRIQQARRIISSVRIVVDESPIPVPAFVHVRVDSKHDPEEKEDKYTSIMSAMKDPQARDSVLGEALRILQGYRRRFALLTELASIWYAIDEAAAEQEKKRAA